MPEFSSVSPARSCPEPRFSLLLRDFHSGPKLAPACSSPPDARPASTPQPPRNATKFPSALAKSSASLRKPPVFPPLPRQPLTESWLLQDTTWRRLISGMSTAVDVLRTTERRRVPSSRGAPGEGRGASAPSAELSAQAREARAFQTAARRGARRHCACSDGLRQSEAPGPLSNKLFLRPRLSLTPPLSGLASR